MSHVQPILLLGVVLAIISVLALAYQGITYTPREKVLDLGPLKASVEKQKTICLSPSPRRGGACGVILVLVGNKGT